MRRHISPEERAVDVLAAMGVEPETRAAGGRYVRARDTRAGVRFWATTHQRYRQDLAGIQFYGRARAEGERLASLLERNGFIQRTPQAGQITFAKPVDYADDGGIDTASMTKIRDQIERLIEGRDTRASAGEMTFRDFMLASPLAEIDLPEPDRAGPWRREAV